MEGERDGGKDGGGMKGERMEGGEGWRERGMEGGREGAGEREEGENKGGRRSAVGKVIYAKGGTTCTFA